jgi:hypothetical protein
MELRATERRTSMVVSFIRAKLGEFVRNESGATAIEYGLIAALERVAPFPIQISMRLDL